MTKRKHNHNEANDGAPRNSHAGTRYSMFANLQQVPSNFAIAQHLFICTQVLSTLNPVATSDARISQLRAEAYVLINAKINSTLSASNNNMAPRP